MRGKVKTLPNTRNLHHILLHKAASDNCPKDEVDQEFQQINRWVYCVGEKIIIILCIVCVGLHDNGFEYSGNSHSAIVVILQLCFGDANMHITIIISPSSSLFLQEAKHGGGHTDAGPAARAGARDPNWWND